MKRPGLPDTLLTKSLFTLFLIGLILAVPLSRVVAQDAPASPTNDAPVAVNDAAYTQTDTPVTIDVLANDSHVNGDPLTVTNLTQPSSGTVSLNPDNSITYTPAPAVNSTYTFTYTAYDGASNSNVATVSVSITTAGRTPPNFKVAFIGDQGLEANPEAVLQLISGEAADMVLHQGDFDYADNPDAWDAQINAILGPSFPYFATVGNHDVSAWAGYQQKLLTRLAQIPGATCLGDYGVAAACTYQGLFFILSGVGTRGSDHATYIRDQLANDQSVWRICSWHKNQNAMQVGGKGNEVGWGPYEECRKGGAIIATAHEHSYERTKTLISTEFQTVDPLWPDPDLLRVGNGSTFVFVSGVGGRDVRDQERCLPATPPYGCNGEWASIYTSTQGAKRGALFIEFNVDGDPAKARGYFKNIDGVIVDSFAIFSEIE